MKRLVKMLIVGIMATAVLSGCGDEDEKPSSSSVEASSSSVETSTSSTESSSTSMSSSSTESSSSSSSSSVESSSTESSSSSASSSTSSSSVESSSTESTSSSTAESTSSSASTPTTTPSTGETSKPTIQTTSQTTTTSTWNPDAPGNTPGPYGGYYDATGTLHVKHADMPVDSEGFPLKSYTDEEGQPRMCKSDKEVWDAEEERIAAGGGMNYDNDPEVISEIWELLNS